MIFLFKYCNDCVNFLISAIKIKTINFRVWTRNINDLRGNYVKGG